MAYGHFSPAGKPPGVPSRRKAPEHTTDSPKEHPARDYRETEEFQSLLKGLGNRIRIRRQQLELTLEQASARMDMELRHLQKLEHGLLNPSLVTLHRISKGLGISLEELFHQGKPG